MGIEPMDITKYLRMSIKKRVEVVLSDGGNLVNVPMRLPMSLKNVVEEAFDNGTCFKICGHSFWLMTASVPFEEKAIFIDTSGNHVSLDNYIDISVGHWKDKE